MNLGINNTSSIGFQGKNEILYGLNKAAKLTRANEYLRTSYSRCPAGAIQDELNANSASARAYLDIVLKDRSFAKVVKEVNEKDIEVLRALCSEEKVQYGTVKPFDKFKEALSDVINKNYSKNKTKKEAADNLLKKLV